MDTTGKEKVQIEDEQDAPLKNLDGTELPETEEEIILEGEEGEGEEEEEEVVEKEQEKQQQAPKPYTDEEVLEILDTDGKLDRERLTPTQRLIQRSFQKHATKGYQEIAQIKRELASVKKEAEAPPRTIEEAFDKNPSEVLNWLDGQIASVANEAEKDPFNAIKQLSQLQATRNRLTDRSLQNTESRRRASDVATEAIREVTSAIPDFEEKQTQLSEFAINELGYTMEELQSLTHPSRGTAAARVVKTINAAYDALYGRKEKTMKATEKKKVVKMPIVEGAGKKEAVQSAQSNYKKAFAKAQETGDWTEVLNLKGILPKLTS